MKSGQTVREERDEQDNARGEPLHHVHTIYNTLQSQTYINHMIRLAPASRLARAGSSLRGVRGGELLHSPRATEWQPTGGSLRRLTVTGRAAARREACGPAAVAAADHRSEEAAAPRGSARARPAH